MSFFDHADVIEQSRGIDPRWLRAVPVSWQDDVSVLDRLLRLAWSERIGKWGLVRKAPGHTQLFDDGVLDGWSIVTWFASHWRPPQMIEYVRGMRDGHAYANPQAAYEAIRKDEAAAYEAMRQQMRDEDDVLIDDFLKNEAAGVRDFERERARALDQTSRAHAHTKVGGNVGGPV